MLNNGNNPTESSMAKNDMIDDIINEVDPEAIPSQYIIMAKIETYTGGELILNGEELDEYLRENADTIVNFKLILDIKKIKMDIRTFTAEILHKAFSI